jgi:hypothetical protein
MRHLGAVAAALLTVGLLFLHASSSEAQQFYAGSGTTMFRVFGCAPNTTLNVNGVAWAQIGECTITPGNVVAAVPIEAWVSAQITGLQLQNSTLQRQVDELMARVQALEGAASSRPGTAPR